jgi:hypothetical protein
VAERQGLKPLKRFQFAPRSYTPLKQDVNETTTGSIRICELRKLSDRRNN